MNNPMCSAEIQLYHLANRYLRQLLPAETLTALKDRFTQAEQQMNSDPGALAWSQRILWMSHWEGVLSSQIELDTAAALLSTAILKNLQVIIHYQDKEKPFRFNVFGLIKRDANLLVIGSYWQSNHPFVLSVRKILSIELTDQAIIEPSADFDLQAFVKKQLNFPLTTQKIPYLEIEFSKNHYRYVHDHALDADQIKIIAPDDYHHNGYFLLQAHNIMDGQRLRQWIKGFGDNAQVIKPDELRLEMEQARLDTRTNLMTATEFKRCLNREIQRCLRDGQLTFALLILDLDHFKQVNDLNGHDFGDIVLLQVADCIRDYDEAARHGGEEFCILLPHTDANEALVIAERIRQQIEQQSLQNQHGKVVPVSASIGLAVYPNDLPDALKTEIQSGQHSIELSGTICSTIFHQADQALYQAKQLGRNRVVMASSLACHLSMAN
jgi:diguanylate cyclase (GGDEF)-like protein